MDDMINFEISKFEMKKYFFKKIDPKRSNKSFKNWKIDHGHNVSSSKLKTNYQAFWNFKCLINPYRKKRLKIGDEIIIPSLCWSTSLGRSFNLKTNICRY